MKWTEEAEKRVSKVPFFVRRKVRKAVEKEAKVQGASVVDVHHLEACRRRYMSDKHHQTRGFEIDQCFGADQCPNRSVEFDGIYERIEALLKNKKLEEFLRATVNGPVKMHHAFRVSVSGCPNACSRPQIVDFGLVGASLVKVVNDAACTQCEFCYKVCKENALSLDSKTGQPVLSASACLKCGACAEGCPSGTLVSEKKGFRIMLGGKLGRHPQLGMELPGLWSHDEALDVLSRCVDHFKEHNRGGERFGDILNRTGLDFLELKI